MNSNRTIIVSILITIGAIAVIIAQQIFPRFLPSEAITIGLLIVAVLPWMVYFVDSAEFPGGWKVKFRELRDQQQKQKDDIDRLKFLITHFVSIYELEHLSKLVKDGPFAYDKSKNFIDELRKLRNHGLIKTRHDKHIGQIPENGDLKEHIEITDDGRAFLRWRQEDTK